MKAIRLILIMILISLLVSGCGVVEKFFEIRNKLQEEKPDYTNGSGRSWMDQGIHEKDMILTALSEGETQPIKDLLCFEIQQIEDIDEQLEILVDFFQGKVLSYDNGSVSKGGGGKEGGVWIDLSMSIQRGNIVTDTGDEYSLFIGSMYAKEDNSDLLGVQSIYISNEDGKRCVLNPLTVNIKEDYDGDYLPDQLEKDFGTRYDMSDSVGDGKLDWTLFMTDELLDEFGITQGMRSDRNDDGIPDVIDYFTDYLNRDVYVMEVIDCYHKDKEFGTLYFPWDSNEDGILDDEEYERMLEDSE